MHDRILNYIKVIILITIVIALFVINNNNRILGHSIISKLKSLNGNSGSNKVNITLNKGILVGNPSAPLTITAFLDYECIFCKQFMDEVFPNIQKSFIDSGLVKMEFRNMPLAMHKNAEAAAKSLICANNQGKFLELRNWIFENQDKLSTASINKSVLTLGLDKAMFEACLIDTTIAKTISFDIEEGIKNNISGTPTFVINGNVYVGMIPFEDMRKIIHTELGNLGGNPNTCK